MERTTWYKNPEMLVALSALFIGVVTAIISIYSANIDRSYARASVWPRLEVFGSANNDAFQYEVTNSGTGPAIIKYASVSVDTKPIKRWSDLDIRYTLQSHISTRIVPPGKTVIAVRYEGPFFSEVSALNSQLQIELCYCSIYNDCWSTSRANKPQPVSSCPVNQQLAFEQ